MKLRVQFFSHLKDLAGASELEIEVQRPTTVAQLLQLLYERTPALRKWDNSILVGVGVEFVERDYLLQPDQELAIMPPVQGG